MMERSGILGAALLALLLSGCAERLGIGREGIGIVIPREELQRRVDAGTGLPYDRTLGGVAHLHVGAPEVSLHPGDSTVGLRLPAQVGIGFASLSGSVAVAATPEYDTGDGSLYLSHLSVREIHLPGISPEIGSLAGSAVAEILNLSVRRYRIHQLDTTRIQGHLARLFVKQARVRDDGLFLRLGL